MHQKEARSRTSRLPFIEKRSLYPFHHPLLVNSDVVNHHISDLLRFTATHLRHREALAGATGENFNVFDILRVSHLEVTTHSPILAELLDPKGRHGQGDAFLRLFVSRFLNDEHGFETKTAAISMEHYAGPVSETSGGRLDIVVMVGGQPKIVIENKIYAPDQHNQMQRYRAYAPDARLFYLTLIGDEPAYLTPKEAEELDFSCLSYGRHLLPWLRDCRKEVSCMPHIRETLSQYIQIIEKLTHQSTSATMNQDLINEIIKTPESLQAFFALRDAEQSVQSILIQKLDREIDAIAHEHGLKKRDKIVDLSGRYNGFSFSSPLLEKNQLCIAFEFGRTGYQDFHFGFACTDKDGRDGLFDNSKLLEAFQGAYPSAAATDWWPASSYFENPYRWWGADAFEGLLTGHFARNIGEKLNVLSKIIEKLCGGNVREGLQFDEL